MVKTVKLGELALVKGGKRLPKGVNLITTPNSHPYIRVRDLNNRHTLELNSDFEYVDDETHKHKISTLTGHSAYCIEEQVGKTQLLNVNVSLAIQSRRQQNFANSLHLAKRAVPHGRSIA